MVQDGVEHRRHARHDRRLGLGRSASCASSSTKRGMMMISAPWRHGEVHHHGHREHVEEGQRRRARAPGRAPDRAPRRRLCWQFIVDVGVGEHGALRRARGAAGVLQHGDVVRGIDGDLLRDGRRSSMTSASSDHAWRRPAICGARQLLALEQPEQRRLGAGQQGREGADDGALQRPASAGLDLVEQQLEVERHHQFGVAVLHLLGRAPPSGIERIVVDDRAAGFEHGKVIRRCRSGSWAGTARPWCPCVPRASASPRPRGPRCAPISR